VPTAQNRCFRSGEESEWAEYESGPAAYTMVISSVLLLSPAIIDSNVYRAPECTLYKGSVHIVECQATLVAGSFPHEH
jgi:hypothetical protein